ncbi:MAG: VWA domain-containing protein, partial [Chloroflexi bacterium]|nr:VWA domain-containing protein [Chloroflexota bacterium]
VTLTAHPQEGYRVRQWIGTDNDPSWNRNTNTVTMDPGDQYVIVEFEKNVTRNIIIPDEFTTLEDAVDAASPGDTNIILKEGVHYVSTAAGIDLQRKAVRIMSTDPNDPNIIANTIIDCGGSRFVRRRAFHFYRGEGPDTLITGVTIRNAYWIGAVGVTGGIPARAILEYDPDEEDPPILMASGTSASAVGYGGAILCENGSAPTFRNVVIEDCIVVAAQGGNGVDGTPITNPDSDRKGDWGGHAGSGSGDGFGGAIACLGGSKPTFINVTIRNCMARGGMGGDGGSGSNPNDGSGWESWGGNAGSASGDGHGGAVYCENGSDAVFRNCVFANNHATSGIAGTPGAAGPGADLSDPYPNPAGPGASGMVSTNGTIVGGAVYQNGANPTFVDCKFTDNMAYNAISLDPTLALLGLEQEELYTYMPGGAIYSGPGNTIKLERCELSRNMSSAVYADSSCTVDFNDCVFSHNQANGQSAGLGSYTIMIDGVIVFRQDFNLSNVLVDYSGGALFVGPLCPDVTLRNCQFYSNSSTSGGGAVRLMSDADLIGCSFSGNKAGGNGGALEGYLDTGDPQQPMVLSFALESCSFGGNSAVDGFYGQGGAIHFEDFDAVFADCYFFGNRAKNGGGLYLTAGNAKFTGGIISNNESIGGSGIDTQAGLSVVDPTLAIVSDQGELGAVQAEQGAGVDIGGGLVCAATHATIEDYTFENNTAGGAKGSGGAITFYGGYVDHAVKNCLFIDNNANRHGGAIWTGLFATPTITNSTFVQNDARRLGGAIFCDWDSDATVRDCIFQNNRQVAVAEADFGNSILTHSLFHENPDGDYGVYDEATKVTQTAVGAELDVTNIGADPLFVEGPLGEVYLSQVAAGQEAGSPAVDAGSSLAESIGLAERTTRTDGEGDEGVVDLGFHFRDHTTLQLYTLTAEVVGGHGTVEPTTGEFYAGTPVPLIAHPEAGWRVAQWAGTTDDASKSVNNLVVMGPDRHVTVEFDQPRTIVVGSAPEYTSVQHAIDAADDGDVVVVPAGTYAPAFPFPRIEISNKNITLMGSNPDDPNVVASTIMRTYRFAISNVGPETIIEGITFRDANWEGADGLNTSQVADDGPDGVSIAGGCMYMTNASPTIRNCNFIDCSATGGDGAGGDGGVQDEHPMGFDGGWAGFAHGGAVYIGYLSSPTFENCTFRDCYAQGGNGGDGGGGVQNAMGGRGGNWEWSQTIENELILSGWDGWMFGPYLDYWKYSGYGGAVYIEYYSSPTFRDCTFENNYSAGGVNGLGGTPQPLIPSDRLNIENFGGAVYIGASSDPVFEGCVFRDNFADTNTVAEPDDIYVSYGGAIAFEDDCSPSFIRCTLENNTSCIGGGIWSSGSSPTIIDCNLVGNSAYHGGGIYVIDSNAVIDSTIVQRNLAFLSNVDANLVSDPNVGFGGVMSWGGGFCAVDSPVEVYNSIFTGNRSLSSGGGVYFGGSDQDIAVAPFLHNCLIYGNTAGRDGGGVSTWKSEPVMSNLTIADNVVTGALGSAYGGGLFVAYDSNAVLTDSIVWGNSSNKNGSQVAVTNGFEYGPRPSTLHIRNSNIQPSVDPAFVGGSALDLVFVVDTTDSMTAGVLALRAAAAQIVASVAMQSTDYRMAVVDFKDFNDTTLGAGTDYSFRAVVPFTEDPTRIINGINTLGTPEGAGGGTDAESVYDALMNTIDGTALGGWRSGQVNRIILLIGDGPPHDPEPPTGNTLATVVNAASLSPSKRIFAVQIGADPLTSVYYTSLAGGTGGAVTHAADALGLAAAVIENIELITHVAPSIYVSDLSRLPGWDASAGTWDEASGNIGEDPLFIAGYYLSQTASGQGRQSPAVDAGSGPADARDIALANRTTRTDGVADANTVDMGYHYAEGVTLFTLTAEALPSEVDGLIHGSVSPAFSVAYAGAADNVVRLVATPEEGWRVAKWTGTDDDTLTTLTNTVTLTQDRHVTVTFEKRRSRVITVPGDYPRI